MGEVGRNAMCAQRLLAPRCLRVGLGQPMVGLWPMGGGWVGVLMSFSNIKTKIFRHEKSTDFVPQGVKHNTSREGGGRGKAKKE